MEETQLPTAAPDSEPVHIDHRARMQILFAILLGLFLSALDQTVVGTAMPRIVSDLNGLNLYTWVATIYLLTATISGPIYGKLSDQFGRKLFLMFGIFVFLLGSALSGLSGSMEQLIIFRGLQGLGAGSLFPIALAVIGDLFTPRERGKYQGLFGAVFGISALIGPALGGWLTDNISWHWVFYVNLPVGAVALFIIWRLLPAHTSTGRKHKIDYLGAAVFTAALVPILVGLTNKQTMDWTDPWVGGLIALGALLGLVFLWVESRAAEPILPLGLFRNRTYSASMVATFLAAFGFFGAIFFLPLWYQAVQGSSAAGSGYQLLPLLAGLILSSIVSGQLVSRTGRYKWITVIALLLVAAGAFLMTGLQATTEPWKLWTWQFIAGLGIGPTFAVFTIIIQNAVPWNQMGVATGNLVFFRQVGGVVGLAIAGTVFGSTFRTEAPKQIAAQLAAKGIPQAQIDQLTSRFATLDSQQFNDLAAVGNVGDRILANVPPEAQAFIKPLIVPIVDGIHQAMSLAIASSLWLAVVAALLAAGASVLIHELPLRQHQGEGAPATNRARPAAVAEF